MEESRGLSDVKEMVDAALNELDSRIGAAIPNGQYSHIASTGRSLSIRREIRAKLYKIVLECFEMNGTRVKY